jgi:cyclic-di-AMP phosphodiesterase PgpH
MTSTAERTARPSLRRAFGVLVVVATLTALLYSVYADRREAAVSVGEPSPQTYVAPVDLQVVDRVTTERQRQAARGQVGTLYTADPTLQQIVIGSLAGSGLPVESLDLLITRYTHPSGIREAELPDVIAEAVANAPPEREREVRVLLERRLVATATPSERLTEAARAAAAAAVPQVMQSLDAGQVIVREGEILTEDHLRTLEGAGLYSPRADAIGRTLWVVVGGAALAILLAMPAVYAGEHLLPNLAPHQLSFLVGITLAVLVVQRFALVLSPSFIFVLVVPLLVAVLADETTALLWAVWTAVFTALLVPATPLVTLIAALVGAVVAVLAVRLVRSRPAVFLAGLLGGAAGGVALVVMVLLGGGLSPLATASAFGVFLAGGVLAGVVALGLLPLGESAFGFLTDFRLLELSNPSHPLLQRLLLEAPGSYQHSQIIANLVEQAVLAIGGRALLARVGALYHDVGKMRRPQFFVENQFSGENPHDRISPHLSYLIITSHVRDGLELLREYKLPRELEPFVLEHHGTGVLVYFYKRALEDTASISELNFRYPGPRPRSKETAVLMLADAVESASRTLSEPSQGSIRALIDRLVEERLQDDQLSQSPLNLHDLEVIANTFERMMTAILHRRITYPTAEEMRGARGEGRAHRRDRSVPAT